MASAGKEVPSDITLFLHDGRSFHLTFSHEELLLKDELHAYFQDADMVFEDRGNKKDWTIKDFVNGFIVITYGSTKVRASVKSKRGYNSHLSFVRSSAYYVRYTQFKIRVVRPKGLIAPVTKKAVTKKSTKVCWGYVVEGKRFGCYGSKKQDEFFGPKRMQSWRPCLECFANQRDSSLADHRDQKGKYAVAILPRCGGYYWMKALDCLELSSRRDWIQFTIGFPPKGMTTFDGRIYFVDLKKKRKRNYRSYRG